MIKDLSGLLDKKYNELIVDEVITPDPLKRGGDEIVFCEPVSISGKLYRLEEEVVFFSGTVSAKISTFCGRCLAPVEEKVGYDFDEVVYAGGREEDYDLIIEPTGEGFDMEDFILNVFHLKLPMTFLCDEECKGLCPVCGTNLNTSECSCNEAQIDERFAVLKDLFKDR